MASTKTPRIGARMVDAIAYVAANEGCTQQRAGIAIGPNNSHAFGVRILARCYSAGLIEKRQGTRANGYALHLTDKGSQILAVI